MQGWGTGLRVGGEVPARRLGGPLVIYVMEWSLFVVGLIRYEVLPERSLKKWSLCSVPALLVVLFLVCTGQK